MRRPVSVLVGLIVCGVAVAAALGSGSGGSPPVRVLPAVDQVFSYQLSADGQGAATIVWSTADAGGEGSMIRASEQNPEGKWKAPVQLGGINESLNPTLAESQSGAAVIVWSYTQGAPGRTVIEAVTRSSPDSAWSAPKKIWSIRTEDGALTTVGIDSAGVATIVWAVYGPADPAIWSANINTSNASATRPYDLIPAGAGGTDMTLAVNGAGAALLSWQRQLRIAQHENALSTVHGAELASYRLPSGKWLAPHQLSTFIYQQQPAASVVWVPTSSPSTVTANGTAITAWIAGGVGGVGNPLQIAARNPLTGRWTPASTLGGSGAFGEAVRDGPHDSAFALWSSFADRDKVLLTLTATSDEGVRWPTTRLPGAYDGFGSFVASVPDGNAAITFAGAHSRILVSTRTAGDAWSTLKLAGRGELPEVAVSNNGSTTVAWEHGTPPNNVLETRTYP